ncbi:MAG: sigma-70 family RNA polymerase sigma factor [Actinomycetota bacterium]
MPSKGSIALVRTETRASDAHDPGEANLVRSTRAGDDESFAELYRRYRSEVYGVCLRRLGERGAAEDVTQDTFLRAYANLHRFDDSRRMLPWLVSIATRRCIDVRRRGSKSSTVDVVDLIAREHIEHDPTLDAVVAVDERRRLERALRRLPQRQRRALLLHALEGWSYADIAAAEGVSISSTKSLLFHARDNLRRSCRRGLLGVLFFPASAFRRRLRVVTESAATRIRSATEPFLGAVGGALAPSASAVVVALAVLAPHAAPVVTPPSGSLEVAAGTSAGTPGSSGSGSRLTASAIQPPLEMSKVIDNFFHPTSHATPEDTQITSVAASPNYDEDRTLLAAGRVPCQQSSCMVLYISRDGGETWHRRRSKNFNGHTVLLPPSYPDDKRIFAMGDSGLEVSDDGGETFRVVVPLQGDVAISPLFHRDDPRILIGATVVTEYWANRDLAKPATLVGPAGTWLTIAFSPAFAEDGTIFVGGISPDTTGALRPSVNRCTGSVCQNVVFAKGFDAPWVRPSPSFARDRTVYAFTSHALFRSIDGGTTYKTSSPSFALDGSFRDLIVLPDGTLIAAVSHKEKAHSGLYRSGDGGVTWTGGRVSVPGFEAGASRIVAIPDGRLIALGEGSGIACSIDDGSSWKTRCAR